MSPSTTGWDVHASETPGWTYEAAAQVATAKATKTGVVRRRQRSAKPCKFRRLQMQPPSPKDHIPRQYRYRDEKGERLKDIEDAAAESLAIDCDALDEAANDEALHQRCDDGAEAECDIPSPATALDLIAEFEGDATQAKRQQHRDQRQVEGGQQDAIGDWEGSEQGHAGHDQPGLVTVPGRRNGIDHPVAQLLVGLREQQGADTEVETVQYDIKR